MNRRNGPYEQNGDERGGRHPPRSDWSDDTSQRGWAGSRGQDDDVRAQRDAWRGYDDGGRGWEPRGHGMPEAAGRFGRDDDPGAYGGRGGGYESGYERGRYARDTSDDAFGAPYPERGWGNFARGQRGGPGGVPGGGYSGRAHEDSRGFGGSPSEYGGSRPGNDTGSHGARAQVGGGYGGFGRHDSLEGAGGNYGADLYGSGYGSGRMPGDMGRGSSATGFRGRGPKGYTRSDERLKEDISERLSDDPQIDASDISVEVKDGVVTLSGSVEERWLRHHVENLVDRCSGVKDIENRVAVSRAHTGQRMRGGEASGPEQGSDRDSSAVAARGGTTGSTMASQSDSTRQTTRKS